MGRLLTALIALGALAYPAVTWAEDVAGTPRVAAIRVGLAGKYKVGHWTPVWITLAGGTTPTQVRLDVTTPDGDRVPVIFAETDAPPIALPANGEVVVQRYVKFGLAHGLVSVRVMNSTQRDQLLARRTFASGELPAALPATQDLLLMLGPSIGIDDAVRKRLRERGAQFDLCQVERADQLPARWQGYDSVNTLIVATSQPGLLEQMNGAQFTAVEQWLKLGGRLLLCVGRRGAEVFGPDSRWARLAPGSDATVTPLRQTGGLENYAGATERLDAVGGERPLRFSLSLTTFSKPRGVVEASEMTGPTGRQPTVMRYPYGFGQIVLVAFDLDQPPFGQWQGRPGLVARLLQVGAPRRRDQAETHHGTGQVAHVGYEDLMGQLWAALDEFSGVTRAEFSWIAALIVVYLLLIGPLDYLLLRKLERLHWTWYTFPLLVLLFGGAAFAMADRWRGNRLRINQVDLVDVDVEQSVARGCTWAHVYSPATDTFRLSLGTTWPVDDAAVLNSQQLFSWQGLPGKGLGGLDSPTGAALFTQPYEIRLAKPSQDARTEIVDLPIPVAGSKSLTARWWADVKLERSAQLRTDSNGLLRDQLTNPLAVDLTDCMVLYENWVYAIPGVWRSGASLKFDNRPPRNLEWRLTRRKVVETKDITTPWEQTSTDIPRILELMMFFQAAGGESYTGLTHRYQPYLDLSSHLRTGRAVVVARGPTAASELRRDNQPLTANVDRQFAFYRIVVPVER
jgi:hypothetical protein